MEKGMLKSGIVHTARAEDVYPTLEPGSVSMVWSDGPYAVGKDTWDKMRPSDLPAWYEPHIREWSRICAPSATVYHWGTSDGWARVHPVYLAAGWKFRTLITWEKGNAAVLKSDPEALRMWPDVTEVCGFYQREGFDISAMARGEVYRGLDEQRCAIEAARFLTSERERAGLTRKALAAYFPSKTGGLTGCVTNWEEGYNFPTWEIWRRLHAALNEQDGAPYLQRALSCLYDETTLRSEYEALRSEYEALRSEYEALRAPFSLPLNTTNVWRDPVPQGGVRLDHPCQKPAAAVRRAILASTRPGDTVLDPFGGTLRVALVCEGLHGTANARRHVSIEMDPGHVSRALEDILDRGRQGSLF